MRNVIGFIALLIAIGTAWSASTRELTDAPEAEIIGFSPDGRYFAFEQYAWDVVSDAVYSAVFVVDRETNALVADFPIGLIPEVVDDQFPGRVGGFDPDPAMIDTGDGTPDLLGLRKAVRAEAQVRLDAMEIGLGGRRLAGLPITQRAPSESSDKGLIFALAPTLPSAIPDGQHIYTVITKPVADALDCASSALPARQKTIDFEIIAEATYPDMKEVGRSANPYVWNVPADSCAVGLWLSDIFAPPASEDAPATVVVMFLTALWQPGVDVANWHALYVKLPGASE